MKAEIEIPQPYAEIIKRLVVKHGILIDEFIETAIRKFLERSRTDAE